LVFDVFIPRFRDWGRTFFRLKDSISPRFSGLPVEVFAIWVLIMSYLLEASTLLHFLQELCDISLFDLTLLFSPPVLFLKRKHDDTREDFQRYNIF